MLKRADNRPVELLLLLVFSRRARKTDERQKRPLCTFVGGLDQPTYLLGITNGLIEVWVSLWLEPVGPCGRTFASSALPHGYKSIRAEGVSHLRHASGAPERPLGYSLTGIRFVTTCSYGAGPQRAIATIRSMQC